MKKLLIPLILSVVLQLLPQMACAQDIEGDVFVDPSQPEIDSLLNATHPGELATTTNHDSLSHEIAQNYYRVAYITSNNDTCLKYALLSLEYCLSTDSLLMAKDYNLVGYVYYMKDESRKALPYRFKAADLYNKLSRKSNEALVLIYIGNSYEDLNMNDSIFYYYGKAIKYLTEAQDSANLITAYNGLGRIYDSMGLFSNAQESYQTAMDYATALNDTSTIAFCYLQIGQLFLRSGKSISLAIENLTKSAHLYKLLNSNRQNDRAYKYYAYRGLAKAYIKEANMTGKKEYADSSYIYLKKVGNYYLTIGSNYNYILTRYDYVNYLVFYKKYKEALAVLKDVEKYLSDNSSMPVLETHYRYLYEVYTKLGDYRNALHSQEKYMEYNMAHVNDSALNAIKNAEVERTRMLDSVNHHYETLRIEAEHQQEMTRARVRTRVLLSIALVFILVGVILFFFYRTTKENEENKLRNKALEVERSLLRTQMNPHFIFNALNSVQSFIMGNNTQDAVRFLSKFAKLMRMILNNSMVQSVALGDEMESLSLYLDLERARFNNKFNYSITIDDSVEEDLVSVPPMLIQPFIENAIIHGLMHKTDGEGLITIKITKNGTGSLTCQITDNGVGRKAAAEIEKGCERKHKSVGMQLTRDRLRDLNSEANAQMSCVITDLEDEAGKALGTQVTIILPLVEENENEG